MRIRSFVLAAAVLGIVGLLGLGNAAAAAEINVMISGGLTAAYNELAPEFERATGHKLHTVYGPSMGTAPDAIPIRLQRGEPADVLIMVGYALGDLIAHGKAVAGSRVDLVRSSIGMAVRAGAPKPEIGTVDGVRNALLAAKSIAYSDSASGVYVSTEMFQRLGIADAVKDKAREIKSERVGNVVARGDAEIGFQQMSELKPVPGIDVVGPLPPPLQKITVFAAGVSATAQQPAAAKQLIEFLASPAAASAIVKSGLEPIAAGERK
ncbi:MAG TPA: substrate-binding domain-containing protein [Stellaceae bacterium]|nr:substrate-binding domain-containing protein [Stellaceae bacterium]